MFVLHIGCLCIALTADGLEAISYGVVGFWGATQLMLVLAGQHSPSTQPQVSRRSACTQETLHCPKLAVSLCVLYVVCSCIALTAQHGHEAISSHGVWQVSGVEAS